MMRVEDTEPIVWKRTHTTPRTDKGVSRGGQGKVRDIQRRNRPFIGWDGEGYTTAGVHHYAMFGNSMGQVITGHHLEWRQCLPLLIQSEANANHVIYAGTYDCVMMFANHPDVAKLLHGEMVYMDQYRVHYLRGKMLRVTDRELRQTRTLYDVFTFFGTSFVKACREYLGDSPTLDAIEQMKLQRNTFTPETLADGSVRGYMGDELRLLVELCTTLRERLALVNIHPHQWHGPGAVASTVLKDHGIAKFKGEYDDRFRKVAESAYYGGRFEQFQRGTYLGPVYQYDIRSAYPDAMRHLPSLVGATWEHRKGAPEDGFHPHGLYRVIAPAELPTDTRIGHLPHRNQLGCIYYPAWSRGWYWGVEIPDAIWPWISEHYHPTIPDPTLPFAFVQDMYNQRAKLKRANQPHQLALKLALNSLYGKLAQSKGAKPNGKTQGWTYPTFHEVVWAGLITAYTRRKLSDAMHMVDPTAIIACETDSVFSRVPIPGLTVGDRLGDWDMDTLQGVKYIQSGVSLVKVDGEWKFKTRGFTVKRTEDEVAIWSTFLAMAEPVLTVKQTRFGTDPRNHQFGRWFEAVHHLRLDVNPMEKRIHTPCHVDPLGYDAALHPLTVPNIPVVESTPYQFVWRSAPNTELAEMISAIATTEYEDPILKLEYMT